VTSCRANRVTKGPKLNTNRNCIVSPSKITAIALLCTPSQCPYDVYQMGEGCTSAMLVSFCPCCLF
jgi:hypothetical protein